MDDEKVGEESVDVDLKLRVICSKESSSYGMELLVVAPAPYGGSAGRADGGRARSGARFEDKVHGASQIVVKLWAK